jgi:hypothetical protein
MSRLSPSAATIPFHPAADALPSRLAAARAGWQSPTLRSDLPEASVIGAPPPTHGASTNLFTMSSKTTGHPSLRRLTIDVPALDASGLPDLASITRFIQSLSASGLLEAG